MSAPEVYQRIRETIAATVGEGVDASTVERLSLYVTGMLKAKNGSPAQVSKALKTLGLRHARAESLERQIRRMENDSEISAGTCFHPLARAYLSYGKPQALLLIVDPTLQEDRLVMLSLNVWYRGRTLPVAWSIWPANCSLEGEAGFWQRVEQLLDQVAKLLPKGVPITVVADRAFGTPAFTDLVAARGWDWVVRVQDQTLYQDRLGREGQIGKLVRFRNQRKKLRGQVFKKAGWREASVVVYWGRRHKKALCLVSSHKPDWQLLRTYRQRFPIEGTFRDYKSYGWRWEQGQVTKRDHMERLLVGMAIATWIALMTGTWRAILRLQQPTTGKRRTRPWEAKMSLFQLGLDELAQWFHLAELPFFIWGLTDWLAPNWSTQLTAYHAQAFLLAH